MVGGGQARVGAKVASVYDNLAGSYEQLRVVPEPGSAMLLMLGLAYAVKTRARAQSSLPAP